MKVYKIELLIIDHEEYGANVIKDILENNRSINITVMKMEEKEIGEWQDNNLLNFESTQQEEYNRIFNKYE